MGGLPPQPNTYFFLYSMFVATYIYFVIRENVFVCRMFVKRVLFSSFAAGVFLEMFNQIYLIIKHLKTNSSCKWRKQDTFYKNSAHKNVFLNYKKIDSAQNISPKVALTRLAAGGTTSCRWWLRCPAGALGDARHRRSPVPVTWTPPHLLLVFLLLILLFLIFCFSFLPPYWISHGPFIFSLQFCHFRCTLKLNGPACRSYCVMEGRKWEKSIVVTFLMVPSCACFVYEFSHPSITFVFDSAPKPH